MVFFAINGSGKTTLFRAISNLIPISSGNIAVPPSYFIMKALNGWMETYGDGLSSPL